ncbi:MAG: RsmB/NOP family class I SAM-dependent RNA methyltransferase [Rhodobacteraceae bacterium]|nr:RsmB/NOP family class I SAM-dependent RNA methyltransferase [Paracoccaceae bacterium]
MAAGARAGAGGEEAAAGRAERGAALDLLVAVLGGGRTLAAAEAAAPFAALAPAGRARARRLAAAALRHGGRADRLLGPLLRWRPAPAVHAALHLALAEIFAGGGAAHAAVDAAVALVAARAGRPAADFANAVLRKAVVAGGEGGWARLAPGAMPAWLRRPVVAAWGGAVARAIEAAHERGAALDLTPREPAAASLWAARLGATLLPTGSLRLPAGGQVTALPGYDEGAWWVQDAAAALPARVLAAKAGEEVVDLCAAPGGKTLQLAAAGARVTAVEPAAPRMALLAANLARCRLAADCVQADALAWAPPSPVVAVLLDPPCTATGTIRRHPDLPALRDGAGLDRLRALQATLLDRAAGFLAPGGRLVYAVCSLLPAEGEDQLAAALARHPDLAPDPSALALPGVAPEWITRGGGLRLRPDFWPGAGGMDGFFVACLRRTG